MSKGLSGEVVRAVLTRRWKSTNSIMKKLKYKNAASVRRFLTHMMKEGVVESIKLGRMTYWRLTKAEAKVKKRATKEKERAYEESMKTADDILKELKGVGLDLYGQLSSGRFPSLDIPSRSTSNIKFDPVSRQYVLAGRMVTRSARNIGQIKSLTQLIWIMRFVRELLRMNKSSTLRDVYYSSEAYKIKFLDQQESDSLITDVEAVIETPREDFKIFPEERSAIYGDLTVEYTTPKKYRGKRVNMMDNPDGVMIGPHLINSKFVNCSADKIIAIESGGMFTRFIEEGVHENFNAILLHTAGQAPRSTRRLIRRLHYEFNIPAYVFTDGDPWGVHIAMVIISGSATAAHLRGLATPDAVWMGVWATDIEKYNLPTDKFTEQDIKRTKELRKDPRYKTKFWQDQLRKFLSMKKKAEQQAFSRYGLTYVVDEYLPAKFKEIDKLKRKGVIQTG